MDAVPPSPAPLRGSEQPASAVPTPAPNPFIISWITSRAKQKVIPGHLGEEKTE